MRAGRCVCGEMGGGTPSGKSGTARVCVRGGGRHRHRRRSLCRYILFYKLNVICRYIFMKRFPHPPSPPSSSPPPKMVDVEPGTATRSSARPPSKYSIFTRTPLLTSRPPPPPPPPPPLLTRWMWSRAWWTATRSSSSSRASRSSTASRATSSSRCVGGWRAGGPSFWQGRGAFLLGRAGGPSFWQGRAGGPFVWQDRGPFHLGRAGGPPLRQGRGPFPATLF